MMEFGLVLLWLVVLVLLAGLALPIATWLLPNLDAGAVSFALALTVIGVVGHLVGHVAFGWLALLGGLIALLVGAYLTTPQVDPDWRRFGEASVVFTLAFLLIVAIRAMDPAASVLPIAIGEKFLDYGLLRSLERAPALPPEDVWFAGRTVRYHYGGHMLTVLLGTLTGTGARFAYNLGLATFFASLVTTAYGLAGSIAIPYTGSRRLAAAFGAFLVGIAGNFDTAGRVLIWLLPDGGAAALAGWLGFGTSVLDWTPTDFWYFRASRVLPIDPTAPNPGMAATEFPLFAWINADLHAHMMSQPFMLLLAVLGLAYWRTAADSWRRWLLLGAMAPVTGLIGVINVWSLPTAGGLNFLVVWLASGSAGGPRPEWMGDRLPALPGADGAIGPIGEEARRLFAAGVVSMGTLLLGLLLTAPFWLLVALGGPGYEPGLWGRWAPLGGLLRVHGPFLVVFVPFFARWLGDDRSIQLLAIGGGLGWFVATILLGMPGIGLAVPIGVLAWWFSRADSGRGFEAVLILAGAGLVVLVELLTLEGERFNVIFKYYAHVWLFWSVAGGVVLARLVDGWPSGILDVHRPRWRTSGRVIAVALILTTGLYAGFALPAHFDSPGPPVAESGPTLDATGYLETSYPAEAAAIRWLDGRTGRPTLLVAAAGWDSYWWRPSRGDGASAPASLTGLPTVIGWFHERQYRGVDAYQRRLAAVKTLYTGSASQQRALLSRYGVDYVYVGPVERAKYGEITIDEHDALVVAESWESVTIYEVDRSRL